jgi:hypothetical protein
MAAEYQTSITLEEAKIFALHLPMSWILIRNMTQAHFYFPHSIGFTCKKNIFFIANFHVLGLYISKKSDALVGRV